MRYFLLLLLLPGLLQAACLCDTQGEQDAILACLPDDPPIVIPPVEPGDFDSTAMLNASEGMVPGEWREIPNTIIPLTQPQELLAIQDADGGQPLRGGSGPKAVITAWNSAAYDEKRGHLYFIGGGHGDYGGNEVFRFNLSTLTWTRLTLPAALNGPNEAERDGYLCQVPIGSPAATHTWDGLIWNPVADRLWLFPHRGFCYYGRVALQWKWWEFDPVDMSWTEHQTPDTAYGYAGTTWLPNTGQVFVRPAESFDPNMGTVGPLIINPDGSVDQRGDYKAVATSHTATFNPIDGSVLAAFGPGLYRQNLPDLGRMELLHYWPQEILDVMPPRKKPNTVGWEFDSDTETFLLWPGGRETIEYDSRTEVYTILSNAGSVEAPFHLNSYVFGHWQRIPQLGLYVAYNNPDEGFWIYKR